VRPGGLLMFVTSAGTMNKIGTEAREYLADRADLVGAIRLPGNAFKKNAGTEVTTDIVILRKRLPGEKADASWVRPSSARSRPRRRNQSRHVSTLLSPTHPEHGAWQGGQRSTSSYAGERYSVKRRDNFALEGARPREGRHRDFAAPTS
jgi:hypothetical protein